MIYLFALLLHIFGTHTERPYGKDFKDDWNKGVGEGEYRCIICHKIVKREEVDV